MLLTFQEGPVATITLNRPEVLNMLTHELILRLTEEIRRWSAEKAVRVIILTGSGEKAFVGEWM
jgi:enoyl-CoA hydratase